MPCFLKSNGKYVFRENKWNPPPPPHSPPPSPPPTPRSTPNGSVNRQGRRSGLPAAPFNVDKNDYKPPKKHAKSEKDEEEIKNALKANEFLNNLLKVGDRMKMIVDAMYHEEVKNKRVLIEEGSVGSHLYVSHSGSYDIYKKGKYISTINDVRVFGELAILYNEKRQATIKCMKKGTVWVLDRDVYQQIVVTSALEEQDEKLNFLHNVPTLNKIQDEVLRRVCNLLKLEFFTTGTDIVREGDHGEKFYIIRAGTVTIKKSGEGEVGKLCRGQYFGERALLKEDRRQATVSADAPGVECLTLSKAEFEAYIGNIETITIQPQFEPIGRVTPTEYSDIELSDLTMWATLGVGGFGRVELVQHKQNKKLVFALKYLKKIDMVQQQQQEHAFNEKNIQMSCDTMFIAKMYKTFKDAKFLYFLMESCLGGDLWTLLQQQKSRHFDEPASRFYAACVLEAFDYLHRMNIVYRDLKPENLLLDKKGYLKLTDFGFAKQIGPRGKTFTFAGTPEYVAPEIVLNRGHDKAVDYWAFGIFVYELLVGKTPFRTNDSSHMKTYNLILKGIDNVRFPEVIPKSAQNLIKRLCRSLPSDRLGCQKDGCQDIRAHKWFANFEWNKLKTNALSAPFKRPLKSDIDTQYFEKYPKEKDIPVDELSGWDTEF